MAYIETPSGQVETAKPVKSELLSGIRDNQIDREDRISSNEAATNAFWPIIFELQNIETTGVKTVDKSPFAINVLGCEIFLLDTGTAGDIEVDVDFGPIGGPFVSIFDTLPKLAFGSVNWSAFRVHFIKDAFEQLINVH